MPSDERESVKVLEREIKEVRHSTECSLYLLARFNIMSPIANLVAQLEKHRSARSVRQRSSVALLIRQSSASPL